MPSSLRLRTLQQARRWPCIRRCHRRHLPPCGGGRRALARREGGVWRVTDFRKQARVRVMKRSPENGARDIPGRIAAAFVAACREELDSPKPGNVHVFADGHRMNPAHFIRSAEAAAGPLTRPGAKIGQRILGATEATLAVVGMNTNLGIILLCAPLAAAAEQPGSDLRAALARLLHGLDREDAALAFRAIALASPGGLGRVERYDVRAPATVSLREAMTAA